MKARSDLRVAHAYRGKAESRYINGALTPKQLEMRRRLVRMLPRIYYHRAVKGKAPLTYILIYRDSLSITRIIYIYFDL